MATEGPTIYTMGDPKAVETVKTPGTLSGKPRIEAKRIGVLMLGDMLRRGECTYSEVLSELDVARAELACARFVDSGSSFR